MAKTQKRILIVTEGRTINRPTEVSEQMVAHTRKVRPEVGALIDIHYTGTPVADLTAYGVVLFRLADPPKALFPDIYADAIEIADACAQAGVPILQHPDALNNTQKSTQSEIWQAHGIRSAKSIAIPSRAALDGVLKDLPYPCILRPDLGHGKDRTYVCQDEAALLSYADKVEFPAVALEYFDIKHTGSDAGPYGHYYHKKRSMVFGDIVMNSYVYFSEARIIRRRTSLFTPHAKTSTRLLYHLGIGRAAFDSILQADLDYFHAPPEAPDLMTGAMRALGLEIAALDYSVGRDGEIVFWEANPHFVLPSPAPLELLPKLRQLDDRTTAIYDGFATWMATLAQQYCGGVRHQT